MFNFCNAIFRMSIHFYFYEQLNFEQKHNSTVVFKILFCRTVYLCVFKYNRESKVSLSGVYC